MLRTQEAKKVHMYMYDNIVKIQACTVYYILPLTSSPSLDGLYFNIGSSLGYDCYASVTFYLSRWGK